MTSNRLLHEFDSDTITEKTTFIKRQKQGTAEEARHYLHLFLSCSHSLRTSRAAICSSLGQFPLHSSSTAQHRAHFCLLHCRKFSHQQFHMQLFSFEKGYPNIFYWLKNNTTNSWKVPDKALSVQHMHPFKKKKIIIHPHILGFNSLNRIFVFENVFSSPSPSYSWYCFSVAVKKSSRTLLR